MNKTTMRDYVLHELPMNIFYEMGCVQDKKYIPITNTVEQNDAIASLIWSSFPNVVYNMYLALAEHHCCNYDNKEFVWYYLRMKVVNQDASFEWLDNDSISVVPISFNTMNNALSSMYETLVQWSFTVNNATGKYSTNIDAIADQMRMQRDLMKHCINDRALHVVDYDDFAQDQLPKKTIHTFITQLAKSITSKQVSKSSNEYDDVFKTLSRSAAKTEQLQNKGSGSGELYYDHQYYDSLTSSGASVKKVENVSNYCPYDIYDL